MGCSPHSGTAPKPVILGSVFQDVSDSTPQIARPMKQTYAPQPVAAPEAEQPAEFISLASESTVDSTSTATTEPYEIPERGEDLHYAGHCGINE